jgi:hypothetical protein
LIVTSVSCPQGDGGLCAVPDPAVMVADGEFSLVGAKAVRLLYPDIDSREPERIHLTESVDYRELVQNVARILAPEPAVAGFGEADDHQRQAGARMLEAVASAVGSTSGILVHCSCGHLFKI